MKSNYSELGEYIREVNERNSDLAITNLLGVSMEKTFIQSVANLNGVDMSIYKVLRKEQLACKLMSVGRDEKLPVDLYREQEPSIVSSAYYVFEPKDKEELLPEYLMMWLCRPENDRYIGFISGGDVRGGISWETFCSLPIKVPSINKQIEIVKEYNVIQNRIALNQQLIQKLEETAQAIYKAWFVEFEFPYDFAQGKPDENGNPYKSNGGEMVWNEELQKEIPLGWEVEQLGNIIESFSKTHSFKKDKLIFFNTSDILDGEFLHSNYMDICEMPGQAKKQIKKGDILFSEIRPNNKRYSIVRIEADDYIVSTKLMVLRKRIETFTTYRLYQFLTEESFITELQQTAEGRSGTFPQITFEEDLQQKPFLIADKRIEQHWNSFLNSTYNMIFSKKDENKKLIEMKDLLLSKLATIEN